MRKVISSKYDGATKEILDVIELFQPVNTIDIIQLSGLESNHAFAVGILHTLTELGLITRDEDTGLYWYTPFNAQYTTQK